MIGISVEGTVDPFEHNNGHISGHCLKPLEDLDGRWTKRKWADTVVSDQRCIDTQKLIEDFISKLRTGTVVKVTVEIAEYAD